MKDKACIPIWDVGFVFFMYLSKDLRSGTYIVSIKID